MEITQADLLQALADAIRPADGPADAKTFEEMKALTSWGENRLRAALKVAKGQGLLEVVQVARESLSGGMVRVPAYRLKS